MSALSEPLASQPSYTATHNRHTTDTIDAYLRQNRSLLKLFEAVVLSFSSMHLPTSLWSWDRSSDNLRLHSTDDSLALTSLSRLLPDGQLLSGHIGWYAFLHSGSYRLHLGEIESIGDSTYWNQVKNKYILVRSQVQPALSSRCRWWTG